MKAGLAALALAFAAGAQADDVASSAHGGVGIAFREPSANPPYENLDLDFDEGTLVHVTLASHYHYGLLLRIDYAYTLYDALTAHGLVLARDFEQHDARGGLFFAPLPEGPAVWRVGGGYAWAREDIDAPASVDTQDGGFFEIGVAVPLGKVRFDIAGAAMKLEGDADYDAEGAEVRFGSFIDLGAIELALGGRYLMLQRQGLFDEEVVELRIGFGGAWGYPENRW